MRWQEQRVVRVASVEPFEQLERLSGLAFVPQIDEMELEVGFALEELAALARLHHLAQALDPIAAGEQQQPAQHLRGGRGDVGVVVIDADAEVRIVQRRGRAGGRARARL